MVDNFEKIEPYLSFADNGIYHLQILQRSKDGNDKSVRLICEWFITNIQRFKIIEPGIKALCNIYNARAYINLNEKSKDAILFHILEKGLEQIKNSDATPTNLMGSAVGNVKSKNKIWVIDIDDLNADIELFCNRIEQCQSGYTKNVIDVLETVNGYHILTCPFDISQLNMDGLAKFDIHKNNPTLLYAP